MRFTWNPKQINRESYEGFVVSSHPTIGDLCPANELLNISFSIVGILKLVTPSEPTYPIPSLKNEGLNSYL